MTPCGTGEYCTCEGDNASVGLAGAKMRFCCVCGKYIDEDIRAYIRQRVSNAMVTALILTVS
jgi:hypothetical protein